METEKVLFQIFSELVILSEIYESLDDDQIITISDTVNFIFSELPPQVIDRYKAFLKASIEREETRGAFARASALRDHASALGLDEAPGTAQALADTEEILFKVFNETAIFSVSCKTLDQDQVVTIVETVDSWFSKLPADAIDRYRDFLKALIERETDPRVSVLQDIAMAFEMDEES